MRRSHRGRGGTRTRGGVAETLRVQEEPSVRRGGDCRRDRWPENPIHAPQRLARVEVGGHHDARTHSHDRGAGDHGRGEPECAAGPAGCGAEAPGLLVRRGGGVGDVAGMRRATLGLSPRPPALGPKKWRRARQIPRRRSARPRPRSERGGEGRRVGNETGARPRHSRGRGSGARVSCEVTSEDGRQADQVHHAHHRQVVERIDVRCVELERRSAGWLGGLLDAHCRYDRSAVLGSRPRLPCERAARKGTKPWTAVRRRGRSSRRDVHRRSPRSSRHPEPGP